MALPSEDLVRYTPGQVAVGQGKLRDSTMAKFSYTNNGKLKHSMLRPSNGFVIGSEECTGSIEIEVTDTGPERDFFGDIRKGKVVKFQYEIPTLNVEITGIYTGIDVELPTGDAVKLTLSWIGKLSAPVAVA